MLIRLLYASILLLVLSVVAALPLIKVPVTASARGIVRPLEENTQLIAVTSGKLVQTSLTRNNQSIIQGDTLAIITTKQLDVQKDLKSSLLADYRMQSADLENLISGSYHNLRTGQYQKELSTMKERIAQIEVDLQHSKKELDRATLLYDQQVIPTAEFEKVLYRYQGLCTQIEIIREQQTMQWQIQKAEVNRQLKDLAAEIMRIEQEQKNHIIIAPISGRLTDFSGIRKDNFIVQGQKLGEISPEELLTAECHVPPRDIGFIRVGQTVRFQVDPYNYNQWGLLEGTVQEIDHNVQISEQGGQVYFRVICRMEKDFLELKNSQIGPVTKGMTLTARFELLERSIWQLLFDRLDDWFNPRLK